MSLQQRMVIGLVVVAGFIFWNFSQNQNSGLTNDELNGIINTTREGFVKAENKILGDTPVVPDDTPSGPDPDPKKCICQGTGKIVQGDGHVSPCPYHSGDAPEPEQPEKEPQIIQPKPSQPQYRTRPRLFPRLFNRGFS